MLTKYFVITVFITKRDKKEYYKVDRYYKVRQNLLQNVTGITKCSNVKKYFTEKNLYQRSGINFLLPDKRDVLF